MKFKFLATWQKLSEQEGGSVASRKTARSQRKTTNMKSYNHLFEKLLERENIIKAIRKASKRKTKRKDVSYILSHIEETVKKIRQILLAGYKPQWHEMTDIFDKTSNKYRRIVKPYFYKNVEGEEVFEQIIHHLVVLVLEPIFMRGMYELSCGSIPKRGGRYGKKHLERFIRENPKDCKYCCKFDVHHFYESINTNLLKQRFKKIIHDEKMLQIIFAIIDSNLVEYKGERFRVGVLIGFFPLQWLANWFLQPFDHKIKEEEKIKFYERYVDDCIFLSANKRKLRKSFENAREYLKELDLTLKKNYQLFKFDYKGKGRPIDFMGFKFYQEKTTLRKTILKSSRRVAFKVHKKEKINALDASRVLSYEGWYRKTDTNKFHEKYISKFIDTRACRKIISRKAKENNKCNLKNRKVKKNQSKLTKIHH